MDENQKAAFYLFILAVDSVSGVQCSKWGCSKLRDRFGGGKTASGVRFLFRQSVNFDQSIKLTGQNSFFFKFNCFR